MVNAMASANNVESMTNVSTIASANSNIKGNPSISAIVMANIMPNIVPNGSANANADADPNANPITYAGANSDVTAYAGDGDKASEIDDMVWVAPRMLKHLVGQGHAEFSSGRQQDAAEYMQHLLEVSFFSSCYSYRVCFFEMFFVVYIFSPSVFLLVYRCPRVFGEKFTFK